MATKRQTAKALAGSIEKWRAIVEKRGVDDGVSNCPLCAIFAHGPSSSCRGCPVAKAGHSGCATGVYERWGQHQYNKHYDELEGKVYCGTCIRLAKAELKFLEGLRDG